NPENAPIEFARNSSPLGDSGAEGKSAGGAASWGRPWRLLATRCACHCQTVRTRPRDSAADQPPFRRRKRRRSAENFFQGGSAKQATPFPRQDLLTARNRFRPNFRGWRLDEFSIFARPPPRGPLAHAGTRGIPSDGRCRAGPLICLGRAGDACVVGALERVGDTLYGARVYVKLGRRLAHAHAARQSRSDSLSQLVRDRRPAKSFTFT